MSIFSLYRILILILRATYFKSDIVIRNQISCFVSIISYIQESSVRFFFVKSLFKNFVYGRNNMDSFAAYRRL